MLEAIAILAGYGALAAAVAWSVVTAPAPLSEPTQLLDDGTVSVDGETPADPLALAAGAGVDPNVYALQRCIESEAGDEALIVRQAVAWAIVNEARAAGRSVLSLVTRAGKKVAGTWVPNPIASGHFGRQSQGRYCASSQDAGSDFSIASGVLSGDIDDPTGGARQFDSPKSFGVQGGTTAAGADATAQRRIAAGNVEVLLPGIPERTIRFWRPA
jgi:hypothetical protein